MDKLTVEQFGATVKQKYPQYASYSDTEIGKKMLEKYPQYQSRLKTTMTTEAEKGKMFTSAAKKVEEKAKEKYGEKSFAYKATAPARLLTRGLAGIADIFTSNTQKFGTSVGQTAALPKATEQYTQALEQHTKTKNALASTIRKKEKLGEDTSRLKQVLISYTAKQPKIEDFAGNVYEKTGRQIAGEALGATTELLTVGTLKGAKGFGLARGMAPTAQQATQATQAFRALPFGQRMAQIGKQTAKTVATTAPFGYAFGVSRQLQEGKTGASAFSPMNLETGLSVGIPAGIGALRAGREIAGEVLPRVGSNLSGEPLEAYLRRQKGQVEDLLPGASKEKALTESRQAMTKYRIGMIDEFGQGLDDVSKKYEGVRVGLDDVNEKRAKTIASIFGFETPQNLKSMSGRETAEFISNLNDSYIPNASTARDVRINNAIKSLREYVKKKGVSAFGGESGEFAKLYSNYAQRSKVYKDITSVLGKVGERTPTQINTARNRLYNVFNENSTAYLDAVKQFEEATGERILDRVAAARLVERLPKTLRGAPTGVIGFGSDILALLTFPFSSPRGGSWLVKALTGYNESALTKVLNNNPALRTKIYDAVNKENMSLDDAIRTYIKSPKMGLSLDDVTKSGYRSNTAPKIADKTAVPMTTNQIVPNTANISGIIPQNGKISNIKTDIKKTVEMTKNMLADPKTYAEKAKLSLVEEQKLINHIVKDASDILKGNGFDDLANEVTKIIPKVGESPISVGSRIMKIINKVNK